jgi:hypothetical protein
MTQKLSPSEWIDEFILGTETSDYHGDFKLFARDKKLIKYVLVDLRKRIEEG